MKFLEILISAIMFALVIAFILIISIPAAALWAFVLKDLWLWFMVPLGMTPINAWHAYGLILFVTVFTHKLSTYSKGDEENGTAEKVAKSICTSIVGALLIWGIGAFVRGHI